MPHPHQDTMPSHDPMPEVNPWQQPEQGLHTVGAECVRGRWMTEGVHEPLISGQMMTSPSPADPGQSRVREALYPTPGFSDPPSCEDPQKPRPAGCQVLGCDGPRAEVLGYGAGSLGARARGGVSTGSPWRPGAAARLSCSATAWPTRGLTATRPQPRQRRAGGFQEGRGCPCGPARPPLVPRLFLSQGPKRRVSTLDLLWSGVSTPVGPATVAGKPNLCGASHGPPPCSPPWPSPCSPSQASPLQPQPLRAASLPPPSQGCLPCRLPRPTRGAAPVSTVVSTQWVRPTLSPVSSTPFPELTRNPWCEICPDSSDFFRNVLWLSPHSLLFLSMPP